MALNYCRRPIVAFNSKIHITPRPSRHLRHFPRRVLSSDARSNGAVPDFAFAFDIDGVLLRSAKALPRASQALKYLQGHRIPFILLTNGGGKNEEERVDELSRRLEVPLNTKMFVQSHTPFAELVNNNVHREELLADKCVLVVGGDKDKCRYVAENYGFKNVIVPGDILAAFPAIMPFAHPVNYDGFAKALRNNRLAAKDDTDPSPDVLKVDAILIFNDPRDWVLDTQVILDLLLSHKGYLGSVSAKNNTPSLPNKGFQQDGQPKLYFSNPDLLWASEYHLPRLGQGAFREALEGVWEAMTGGSQNGVKLEARMFGKPHKGTYEFAEKRLQAYRNKLIGSDEADSDGHQLEKVYMVGDNPESDILGANQYRSPHGSQWTSILVRSGVYSGGEPAHTPKVIVEDVWDAVQWALKESKWAS